MKSFLKIFIPFLTICLGVIFYASAAPVSNIFRNILPETTNTYDFGTTTQQWLNIFTQNASTTNLTAFYRLLVGGTATTTIFGNSATLPGTLNVSGLTTLAGFISTASSSITGELHAGTLDIDNFASGDLIVQGNIYNFGGSHFLGNGTATTTLAVNAANVLQITSGGFIAQASSTVVGAFRANSAVFNTALSLASGGTNATSFTTSGNAVYYNGTSLLTAPLGSAITIPYASTTAISSSDSAYFATSGGNVGIGTTNPQNKLDVNGGITANGGSSFTSTGVALTVSLGQLRLGQQGDAHGIIQSPEGMFFNIDSGSTNTDSDSSTAAFYWGHNRAGTSGGAELMRLTETGKLSIGTTSPASLLSVQGNGYFSGTSFFGGAITATSTLNLTGLLTFGNASGTQLTTTGSTYLATTGGNVGIGTTSPAAELSVSSTATSTLHLGTGQSTTKGSCIQMYSPIGTAYRLYVSNAGTLTTEPGSCK